MTIRDRRLYLAAYPTFEAYTEDRWDLERTRVRVDQRGEDDHRTVGNSDIPPVNEAQAKQLAGRSPRWLLR